ncbi:hypothetical protein RSOL_282760, partial [Rhizoctonia solani AG-3 Rhs1AP]
MKFTIAFALVATCLISQADAKWCCCALNKNSVSCCKKIMGADTFFAPGCGFINGQTCDLGPNGKLQSEFKQCCDYHEGTAQGMCF